MSSPFVLWECTRHRQVPTGMVTDWDNNLLNIFE